jgi:hypothetical protein
VIAAMGWPDAFFWSVVAVCLLLLVIATLNNGRRP